MADDDHRSTGTPELDVVICTYDNAVLLDQVLGALGNQLPTAGAWGVLVVANNSGPDTHEVIRRHRHLGRVPSLRQVDEPVQGLTPARLRGVATTAAPWIAFVDDDCVLDEHWVERAIAFALAHPGCAGFGGRVVPTFVEERPAVLDGYGWAFAEQDLGDAPVVVDCLVGAGMVINRAALTATGWTDEPLFEDRVGRKLISGGDVEIALRLAATGRPLWYAPACEIRHVIPPERTAMRYLVRMTRGLGVSWSMASALTWPGRRRGWARSAVSGLLSSALPLLRQARGGVRTPQGRQDLLLASSYEWGRLLGTAGVAAQLVRGRCAFFGRAAPSAPVDGTESDVVRAG